jgi:hypothetical protein
LGSGAAVSEISGSYFLESDNGKRTVTRTLGGGLNRTTKLGFVGIVAEEAKTLDRLAGIRSTVADVQGPARVAILTH